MFRRRRRHDEVDATSTEALATADADSLAPTADDLPLPEPPAPRPDGPFDVSELQEPGPGERVDLGALWVPGVDGMEIRLGVDEGSDRIVAVTIVLGQSALQLQPFAAPRTEGIWAEVRAEISAEVTTSGGQLEETEGPFGPELRAVLPVPLPDGRTAQQRARFVGVDGPRWLLHGVFTGAAAAEPEAAAPLEALLRGVVVVRGGAPMAPRDPIELHLPPPGHPDAPSAAPDGDDRRGSPLDPFERGPEITEIH